MKTFTIFLSYAQCEHLTVIEIPVSKKQFLGLLMKHGDDFRYRSFKNIDCGRCKNRIPYKKFQFNINNCELLYSIDI